MGEATSNSVSKVMRSSILIKNNSRKVPRFVDRAMAAFEPRALGVCPRLFKSPIPAPAALFGPIENMSRKNETGICVLQYTIRMVPQKWIHYCIFIGLVYDSLT